MAEPFVGSEAITRGAVTKSQLNTRYTRLFRDVYINRDAEVSAAVRARAGWLWAGPSAVVAGFSASALHGSRWVDDRRAVELLHHNRHRVSGIVVHSDVVLEDETTTIAGVPLTTPARTALDLACWYPSMTAIAGIDALARETEIKATDIELLARRYIGRRGITRARRLAPLLDAGSQSPKESWLRMVLIEAGLPRPQTQIPVFDDFGCPIAYLDMGWEDIKVAVEYDGEQHRSDRRQYTWDIRRLEMAEGLGWIVVRVAAGDRPAEVIRRVRAARARRV